MNLLDIEHGAREATERDKDELIDVYRDAYHDRVGTSFFSEDRHWQRLMGYAAANGYALVVGRIDGEMIGYALGYRLPTGSKWWQGLVTPVEPSLVIEDGVRTFALNYIMVRRRFRRRGYAKALHDALLAPRDEMRATLLVDPQNEGALSAYLSWGWYKIGDLRPFEDSPTYHAMLKDLARIA